MEYSRLTKWYSNKVTNNQATKFSHSCRSKTGMQQLDIAFSNKPYGGENISLASVKSKTYYITIPYYNTIALNYTIFLFRGIQH